MEENDLPSLTVPNQAMSMRELLERFARGQSVPQSKEGFYTDEDLSDFDKMDRFEKMEAAHNIRQDIETMQKEMQENQEKQKQIPPEKTETKKQASEFTSEPSVQSKKQSSEAKDEA